MAHRCPNEAANNNSQYLLTFELICQAWASKPRIHTHTHLLNPHKTPEDILLLSTDQETGTGQPGDVAQV